MDGFSLPTKVTRLTLSLVDQCFPPPLHVTFHTSLSSDSVSLPKQETSWPPESMLLTLCVWSQRPVTLFCSLTFAPFAIGSPCRHSFPSTPRIVK